MHIHLYALYQSALEMRVWGLASAALALLLTVGCAASTSKPTASIQTTNNATGTGQLVPSAMSVDFGEEMVGQGTTQLVSLTNAGSTNVTISAWGTGPSAFTVTSGSNVVLTPNQVFTVAVAFQPTAKGDQQGNLWVQSDATDAYFKVSLTGSGVTNPSGVGWGHSVSLNWNPSTSSVNGYFVYRSYVSGGPYLKLNPAYATAPSFTDTDVDGEATYYYVVTSVNSDNTESSYSNEVAVIVP